MAIFNSYVKLPEGRHRESHEFQHARLMRPQFTYYSTPKGNVNSRLSSGEWRERATERAWGIYIPEKSFQFNGEPVGDT